MQNKDSKIAGNFDLRGQDYYKRLGLDQKTLAGKSQSEIVQLVATAYAGRLTVLTGSVPSSIKNTIKTQNIKQSAVDPLEQAVNAERLAHVILERTSNALKRPQFNALQNAYLSLVDESKRVEYDKALALHDGNHIEAKRAMAAEASRVPPPEMQQERDALLNTLLGGQQKTKDQQKQIDAYTKKYAKYEKNLTLGTVAKDIVSLASSKEGEKMLRNAMIARLNGAKAPKFDMDALAKGMPLASLSKLIELGNKSVAEAQKETGKRMVFTAVKEKLAIFLDCICQSILKVFGKSREERVQRVVNALMSHKIEQNQEVEQTKDGKAFGKWAEKFAKNVQEVGTHVAKSNTQRDMLELEQILGMHDNNTKSLNARWTNAQDSGSLTKTAKQKIETLDKEITELKDPLKGVTDAIAAVDKAVAEPAKDKNQEKSEQSYAAVTEAAKTYVSAFVKVDKNLTDVAKIEEIMKVFPSKGANIDKLTEALKDYKENKGEKGQTLQTAVKEAFEKDGVIVNAGNIDVFKQHVENASKDLQKAEGMKTRITELTGNLKQHQGNGMQL